MYGSEQEGGREGRTLQATCAEVKPSVCRAIVPDNRQLNGAPVASLIK